MPSLTGEDKNLHKGVDELIAFSKTNTPKLRAARRTADMDVAAEKSCI